MDFTEPRAVSQPLIALADAASVVERIAEDEAAARDERARLPEHGFVPLQPEAALVPLLEPGEEVIDVRPASRLERIASEGSTEFTGRLHLTTRRLILVGAQPLEIDLSAIEELSLVGERLLLGLGSGLGICLDIPSPRVFRVRTAFAIAQAR